MSVPSVSTGVALEYYARVSAQQANIKRQAAELETAAENVDSKLATFTLSGMFELMYETDKDSSAFHSFGVNALHGLVKSYNQLNDISNSSSALSNEGKALLNKVKELLAGHSAATFQGIGLELDKHSGAITFNERLFADKLASDPTTVRNALINGDMLGPVLQETISSLLSKPATAYFSSFFNVIV
jgi:flagellar capping protein FliD